MNLPEQLDAVENELWFLLDRFNNEFDVTDKDMVSVLAKVIVKLTEDDDEEELDNN